MTSCSPRRRHDRRSDPTGRTGRRRRHLGSSDNLAVTHHPRPGRVTCSCGGQATPVAQGVPCRSPHRRMRRTRRPAASPLGPRGQIPTHQAFSRLRPDPNPRPHPRPARHPGRRHLDRRRRTLGAARRLRHRYLTCAQLVNELAEAADDKQLSRVLGRYARLDLLCLDEIGYISLDPRGAELLFQIITAREERASIACASNAPFSEWGNTFTDPASPPPSSTGSPSTPTSSKPAPAATGSPPAETGKEPPSSNQPQGGANPAQHNGAKSTCHSHRAERRHLKGVHGVPPRPYRASTAQTSRRREAPTTQSLGPC